MKDAQGKEWTRDGEDCRCEDGRVMRIVPEMTDDYILSVIDELDAPQPPQVVTVQQLSAALGLTQEQAQALVSLASKL